MSHGVFFVFLSSNSLLSVLNENRHSLNIRFRRQPNRVKIIMFKAVYSHSERDESNGTLLTQIGRKPKYLVNFLSMSWFFHVIFGKCIAPARQKQSIRAGLFQLHRLCNLENHFFTKSLM